MFKNKLQVPDIEDSPSGRCSPIFNWSPLPQKKQLNFTEKDFSYDLVNDEKNLYPNCDVNVWLRTCENEIIEPLDGKITGIIPEWLEGALLRNGPGSLKAGKDNFDHIFDSSALVHRFAISKGKITYQCRFLQSDVYKKNWAANRIVTTEFGTKAVPDPCQTIFQKFFAIFDTSRNFSDNAMISVYPFGDKIYAFNECTTLLEVNLRTLETEGNVNVGKYVNIVNHSSHPHIWNNGDIFNLGMSVGRNGPSHNIVNFPTEEKESEMKFEKARIIATIPARWPLNPSYMHTFGVTENYFIIVEQPLNISLPATITTRLKNDPLASCFRWYPDELTQINIISRKTGNLSFKFFAQSFFYLHIINQYEIFDYIVLDICIYRDAAMLDCMYVEAMKSMQQNPHYAKMFRGRPARFVLPLKPPEMDLTINNNLVKLAYTKAKAYYLPNGDIYLKPEKLCDLGCETPRIHYEAYLGKKYRYFYAISSDVDAENPGTIIKVDTINKSAKTWCETNCYPSEPIFVPKPTAQSEDDGIILSSLVWGQDDTNHAGLVILDAITFTEIARAEFFTPSPVPKCLHGWFLPRK